MRVELTIDGGFAYIPGLAKPIVLDGAQLTGSDLAELRRLCADALAAPNRDAKTQSASLPDTRRYRLTIELDGERHEITAADPVSQPAIVELIDLLRARGR
jgi:hypothetical protein